MKIIILAAGRGSRMKNITKDQPKCLVEFQGKPLLEWQLEAIREAGFSEIGIVTGYKSEMLSRYGLFEFHNPRWDNTQMVSSLSYASDWLEKEPCIVSYSDIFYDAEAIQLLGKSTADIAITFDPNWQKLWEGRFNNPLIDAETFRLNSDGTLAEIGNQPKTMDEIEGQYMGLLRFTPYGWNELKYLRSELTTKNQDNMHMTGSLALILKNGKIPIFALPYDKTWGEVDSIDDLSFYESK